MEQKIKEECLVNCKCTLETIENFFIYSNYFNYSKLRKKYGTKLFSLYNNKIDKLGEILDLVEKYPAFQLP